MNDAIISQLKSELDPQTEIVPWQQIDPQEKEAIEGAILANKPPIYLIKPSHQDNLAKVIEWANKNHLPLLLCGNSSKINWGGLVKNPQILVSTAKLNRIVDYALADLTLTVESGVKISEIQQILQQHQQFLPVDATYPDSATIGGIVATADTGSWRQRYGSLRDLILGISFVRADGKIAKAGGKVVKNVAGYDMMKLLTGSYGTLGVISQVTFRLYPLPEASQTLLLVGNKDEIATVTKTIRMSSLTPTMADLLSTAVINKLGLESGIGLILRFQSIPASVEAQTQQVTAIANKFGLQVNYYQEERENSLWKQLQETITIPSNIDTVTGKIGIVPNKMVKFIHQLDQLTAHQGLSMINIGSGLGKLNISGDNVLTQLEKLRMFLEIELGFLTILEASKTIKQQIEPWGYNGNALTLMQKIKQKFDPNCLLNPGRFVGTI